MGNEDGANSNGLLQWSFVKEKPTTLQRICSRRKLRLALDPKEEPQTEAAIVTEEREVYNI